ncbi:MAG: DMT family transporter [Deltaproteobacteria bacterium]|jgi:drug/metabolite transporter (DMT)-like permease|nr:DMT family transporter [Deltaproteobacteria bacterium]
MKSKPAALLLLALIAVMWSSSGVLVKMVDCPPMALASARALVAAITMSFLLPGGFKPRELGKVHWMAGFCLAALSIFFVAGMKLTAAANLIVLQYTAPIWVAIIAPFMLRERTSGRDWLVMAVIFGGIVLFFLDGLSARGVWGNIFGILSGFFFGLQAMLLRRLRDANPANAMILGNILCFLVGAPFLLFSWPSFYGWLGILALGVFQLGLPYYLLTLCVNKVSSLEMVLVTMVEPILCPIWVYLFLGEAPGRYAFLGGVVVITSVTLWSVLKALDERKLMGSPAS